LSSISDSPKYIVGYDKSEPMYYTEIDLSFDVQGEQCALSNQNNIIKFEKDKNSSNTEFIVDSTLDLSTPGFTTDLSTPIIFDCGMILQSETDVSNFNISLNCVYNSISYNLFSVVLKNIRENSYSSIITPSENLLPEDALTVNSSIIDTSIKNLYHICLRYVSEDGLLLIKFANEEYKLLSLQTTSGYGERIIDTMIVNKFKIPGTFESFGDSNLLSFNLSLSQIKNNVNIDLKDSDIYKIGPYISYYSRTNIA
jgi:hypothetical protein